MFQIDLAWPSFHVDIPTFESYVKSHLQVSLVGISADADMTLWFEVQPSDDDVAAIHAYWDSLTVDSDEAKNYKSQAQRQADAEAADAAAKASANSKLKALGLTDTEIAAILK